MHLLSVIIADDDYLVIEDLKHSIPWAELGYRIAGTATNGQDALALVRDLQPDLLITDIIMPSMTGLEVIERARRDCPDMQVLIITSYDEFEYAKTAISQGVADYILKTQITPMYFSQRLIEISQNALTKKRRNQAAIRQSLGDYFNFHTSEPLTERADPILYAISRLKYRFAVIAVHAPFAPDRETFDRTVYADAVATDDVVAEKFTDSSIPIRFVFGQYLILGFVSAGSTPQAQADMQGVLNKLGTILDTAIARPACVFYTADACTLETFRREFFRLRPRMAFDAALCPAAVQSFAALAAKPCDPGVADFPFAGYRWRGDGAREDLEKLERHMNACVDRRDIAALYRLYWLIVGWLRVNRAGDERTAESRYFSNPQMFVSHVRGLVAAQAQAGGEGERRHPIVVTRAMEYIAAHFGDHDVSVQDIADAVNVSSSRLGVLFRESLGKTINEYLTDVRIEHAIGLLENTSLKIYEVADRSGFNAPHYFSDIMYKKTGKRPIDYKRLPDHRRGEG